jgi:hypothetical protein
VPFKYVLGNSPSALQYKQVDNSLISIFFFKLTQNDDGDDPRRPKFVFPPLSQEEGFT